MFISLFNYFAQTTVPEGYLGIFIALNLSSWSVGYYGTEILERAVVKP